MQVMTIIDASFWRTFLGHSVGADAFLMSEMIPPTRLLRLRRMFSGSFGDA